MSKLGIRREIDSFPAAFTIPDAVNGRCRVTFERPEATLVQIEQINRSAPTLTKVSGFRQEPGLTAGYGFTPADLRDQRTNRAYGPREDPSRREKLGPAAEVQA